MGDYVKHLLNLEETMKKLGELISYIYMTKMSIAWAAVFFAFLVFGSYEIRSITITYIFLASGGLVGIILCVLMIHAMTGEVKEVIRLRELYGNFINSLDMPGIVWHPKTKQALIEFQDLFKRVCPEVFIKVETWPDEPEAPHAMRDAQRAVLEKRKL